MSVALSDMRPLLVNSGAPHEHQYRRPSREGQASNDSMWAHVSARGKLRHPQVSRRGGVPMPVTTHARRVAMGTVFEVFLAGDDEEHLGAVADAVLDEVVRVERLL